MKTFFVETPAGKSYFTADHFYVVMPNGCLAVHARNEALPVTSAGTVITFSPSGWLSVGPAPAEALD